MTHLLTWHGTVVCRQRARGVLVHRKLTGSFDDVDILDVGELSKELQADISHLMRDDDDALRLTLDGGPLIGWTIIRAPDHRSVYLTRNGQSMRAPPHDEAIVLTPDGSALEARFLAISPEDLAALRDVVTAKWLVGAAGASVQPESGVLTAGFVLHIGSLRLDLHWHLPFNLSEWPQRLTVLPEGWRIDRIYRYRPLIYFAAFGDAAIMRQFALSLTSLVTVGAYDGAIVVMTDKTVAEIGALVPAGMRAALVVLRTAARDRLGFQAARLTIGRWPDAGGFQPLLYTDTDTIFDLPVEPMLRAIALSDRLSAVVEPTEGLSTSDMVGSGLLLADGCSPGDEMGFNSGILGIPNLRQHGGLLTLMGQVMHNRLTICGRDSLTFADQPILNYVGYRRRAVDTALISPFVRLAGAEADPAGRRGMVHFCWAPSAAAKVEAMRAYIARMAGG